MMDKPPETAEGIARRRKESDDRLARLEQAANALLAEKEAAQKDQKVQDQTAPGKKKWGKWAPWGKDKKRENEVEKPAVEEKKEKNKEDLKILEQVKAMASEIKSRIFAGEDQTNKIGEVSDLVPKIHDRDMASEGYNLTNPLWDAINEVRDARKTNDPLGKFTKDIMNEDPENFFFAYETADISTINFAGADTTAQLVNTKTIRFNNYHDFVTYRKSLTPKQLTFVDEIQWTIKTGGGYSGAEVFAGGKFWERLEDPNDPIHQFKKQFHELRKKALNGELEDTFPQALEKIKQDFEAQEKKLKAEAEIKEEVEELPKTDKEKASRDPEKEVADFVADFKLESMLPPEFTNLTKEQKLLVARSVQQRIADMITFDARTQYSKETADKNWFAKIRAGLNKKYETKILETKIFKEFLSSDEGKQLIAENLRQLTDTTKERTVELGDNGRPNIQYIRLGEDMLMTRRELNNFNSAANNFREVPYEWGQEKSGKHKKTYEAVKAEYQKARGEILKIKVELIGEEKAMTEMLQLDNILQLDHLLNTHPEVEKEFNNFSKNSTISAQAKDVLHTITGGNPAAFASGMVTRSITALAGVATFIAAPIIGGGIGYWRGKARAGQNLEERKMLARHGVKDTSKEANKVLRAEDMTAYLEKIMADLENADTNEKKTALLKRLKIRIDVTQGKIEQGLMDFGNAKSVLINQFNLVNNLNKAVVLSTSADENIKKEIEERVAKILSFREGKISEAQKEYISKQARNAAIIGATFGLAGAGVRVLGEHMGWGVQIHGNTPSELDAYNKALHLAKGHTPANLAKLHADSLAQAKTDSIAHADSLAHTAPDATRIDSTLKGIPPDTTHAPNAQEIKLTQANSDTATVAGGAAKAAQKAAETVPINIDAGHSLTQSVDFVIGKGDFEIRDALRKIILDHMNLPKDGVTLDAHHAAQVLNIQENIMRRLGGNTTEGITTEQMKTAFGIENLGTNGVKIHVDPSIYKILDHDLDHAKLLDQHGTFDTSDSALGYIKNIKHETWLKDVQGTDMHDTATGPGTGIIGRPTVTQDGIADFSHIANPPSQETVAGDVLSGTPDTGVETGGAEYIKGTSEALDTSQVQNVVPETTPVTGAKIISPDDLGKTQPIRIKDGFSNMPPNQTSEEIVNASQQPYNLINNPFQLSGELLKQISDISKENIHHIFPKDTDDVWNSLRGGSADTMVHANVDTAEKGLAPFINYLRNLEDLSGLKPNPETVLKAAETNDGFVTRALQKIAQMGQLDKVKIP